LLNSWKAKAADKEALQASVNQARDAMKKWGASWGKKPAGDQPPATDSTITAAVRGVGLSKIETTAASPMEAEIKPIQAPAETHRIPIAKVESDRLVVSNSPPTTSLSTSHTSASSSIPKHSPSLPISSASYTPVAMMALPGRIKESNRGGLGSSGPEIIVPQRPGDLPPASSPEIASLLTSALKNWATPSPPASVESTSARKVPPPFFASATPDLTVQQSTLESNAEQSQQRGKARAVDEVGSDDKSGKDDEVEEAWGL